MDVLGSIGKLAIDFVTSAAPKLGEKFIIGIVSVVGPKLADRVLERIKQKPTRWEARWFISNGNIAKLHDKDIIYIWIL